MKVPALLFKLINLKPVHRRGMTVRHAYGVVKLSVDDGSRLLKEYSAFQIYPGLSGRGVSLRSNNYPTNFVQVEGNTDSIVLKEYQEDEEFKTKSSFILKEELQTNGEHIEISFESIFRPNHYIAVYHDNIKLVSSAVVNSSDAPIKFEAIHFKSK